MVARPVSDVIVRTTAFMVRLVHDLIFNGAIIAGTLRSWEAEQRKPEDRELARRVSEEVTIKLQG
jgi:hypothetical protein